jgi:hypothetical protein
MRRLLFAIVAIVLLAPTIGAAGAIVVTGQVLDYEKGFVFFTTGDGFRAAPDIRVLNLETGAPETRAPRPRDWVRATFDASGNVIELDISAKALPIGDLAAVRRFAVALSPTVPNPALAAPTPGPNGIVNTYSGRLVLVQIDLQVPPSTPLAAQVYMTTDQSGWDPQAYRLVRIDALHYRLKMKLRSGTVLNVLFTRGSLDTMEAGPGGIRPKPTTWTISDADTNNFPHSVFAWADQLPNGQTQQPFTIPTPYNPAPFPNLPPGAPGAPRPSPHP